MDDLVIRELQPEDMDGLVEIALVAWKPVFAWYRETLGPELLGVMMPEWERNKAEQIRAACDPESGARVFVAESTARVVGFVSCYAHRDKGWAEIGNNAVHPDEQGRGIAPRLYEHTFQVLREMGIGFVKVSTGADPAHAPARRAYQKAGFEIALPAVTYYRKL